MKRIVSLLLALCAALCTLCCLGCSKNDNDNGSEETVSSGEAGETIMVQIEMDNGGIIKLELYPEVAPITVENFVSLVKDGFYDGLTFHRIIKNFMIQGGDPTGTGMGGSDKTIKGEFSSNGVENTLSHTRGTISMARSQKKDSASSQFFICHADATYLDGDYAAFGRVVEGMDVVDEIAGVKTDYNDKPVTKVVMKSVTLIEE